MTSPRPIDNASVAYFEYCHAIALRFFQNKTFGAADTEDLAQETLRRFLSARRIDRRDPRLFILGTARQVLLEYIQRKTGKQTTVLEQESLAANGAGPSTMAAKNEQERLVIEALRSLPLNLQTVLELHWEGQSLREITEVMEVPYGTCTRWAHEARRRLQGAMEAN